MTAREIERCWQRIEGEIKAGKVKEDRLAGDNRRRGQFQAGWKATRHYTERTLRLLHWNNLGYRFRTCFGLRDDDEIKEAYEYLAKNHDGPLA